jgi:hypothetical protein
LENIMRGKYLKEWGNTPGHVNHWTKRTFTKLVSDFGVIKRTTLTFPWIIIHAEVKK